MLKMSACGLDTSSQIMLHAIQYNKTVNQCFGQMYHQSAIAPPCTTQLRDVRGLALSVRELNKSVSCTFLDNFLFPFVFSSSQKFPESVAEHRSLLIPISFKSKLFLLQCRFEIFTSYLLKFTWQWRHAYILNKKVNSLFTDSIYSCFQICKSC